MARTLATLPEGSRITDYISLGVIAKTFPLERVRSVLAATGKASVRERDLPAHVVVYYAIALALYMQSSYREVLRCLLEGLQWLMDPAVTLKVAGNSGISQARTRLGWEPLRQLHDEVVKPIAVAATKGAWYRGASGEPGRQHAGCRRREEATTKLSVVREPAAARAPIRRSASCRWWRTAPMSCSAAGWRTMPPARSHWPKTVLPSLGKGMLCLADRGFFGFEMWKQAAATGADLLWRVRKNILLPCESVCRMAPI